MTASREQAPTAIRAGLLIDTPLPESVVTGTILATFRLVADEFAASGAITRPVEFVVRHVLGLPNGAFQDVRDAFFDLVAEGCIVVFGPMITENGTPLTRYVETLAEVPVVAMAGTERMLSEWVFALNNGSMADETLVIATVMANDGHRRIAITMDADRSGGGVTNMRSMIGQSTSNGPGPQSTKWDSRSCPKCRSRSIPPHGVPRSRGSATCDPTRSCTWGWGRASSG